MTDKKSIELTHEKAVELLDRAVAEVGEDHIYTRDGDTGECSYFHGERPGCIVGHVLAYAGLGRDDLRNRRNSYSGRMKDLNVGAGPDTLATYGVLKADQATITLLSAAQQKQDEGECWIDAVEAAKELGA